MTAAEAPISPWLDGAEPTRTVLRVHTDQLGRDCSRASVEPHITMLSALVGDRSFAKAVGEVAGVPSLLEPFAEVIGRGVERFTAVFIEFIDDQVGQLAGALGERLCVEFVAARFRSHVSLLDRGDRSTAVGVAIAAQPSFVGMPMWLDTLVASCPGEEPVDVTRWHTPAARRHRG